MMIMLDPGHGGRDPGATHGEARECDVAAQLAEAISARLAEAGLDVAFSRPPQLAPTECIRPAARARSANYLGARGLVSLHASGRAGDGVRFYVLPQGHRPLERRSEALAAAMQTQCLRADLPMPVGAVRRAEFGVLRHAALPAVLVETGLLRAAHDNLLRAAEAYAAGIIVWAKRMGDIDGC